MDPQTRHRASATAARVAAAPLIAVAIAGCGLTGGVVNEGPAIPAGPLGPVLPAQDGGPPVECRGVPIEQCRSFGRVGEPNVVRVIVTCTAVCTPARGDVRIDVLRPDGTTKSMGQGSYASAEGFRRPS